jgi:hypothetical protein
VVVAVATRRTALTPRGVVDVVVADGPHEEAATVAVVARGEPVPANVVYRPAALGTRRSVVVETPALAVEQIKVWVHRRTPEDLWEGVPARVTVDDGDGCREVTLDPTSGQGVVPVDGRALRVIISDFTDDTTSGRR